MTNMESPLGRILRAQRQREQRRHTIRVSIVTVLITAALCLIVHYISAPKIDGSGVNWSEMAAEGARRTGQPIGEGR